MVGVLDWDVSHRLFFMYCVLIHVLIQECGVPCFPATADKGEN